MAFQGPSPTGCVVKLTLHEATGLCKKDIFGASDPYAIIYREAVGSFGSTDPTKPTNTLGRTKTIPRTLNPVWNEAFEIDVDMFKHVLIVDVFDENRMTRDDFLGRVTIPMYNVGDNPYKQTWGLSKRTERSNVTGSLTFQAEVVANPRASQLIPGEREQNWFKQNVEIFFLDPQLDILTGGQWRDQGYVVSILVHEDSTNQDLKFNPDRGELTIPKADSIRGQACKLLKFFFGTDTVYLGDRTKDWDTVLRMVAQRADLRYAELLRKRIFAGQMGEHSSLQEIELKSAAFSGQPRYINKYRTLLVPNYANPAGLISMLDEWVRSGGPLGEEQQPQAGSSQESGSSTTNAWTDAVFSQGEDGFMFLAHGSQENNSSGNTLPSGWEERRDNNGRVFYVDHNTRTTTFTRPVSQEAASTTSEEESLSSITSTASTGQFQTRRAISLDDEEQWSGRESSPPATTTPSIPEADGLPEGWEAKRLNTGMVIYINHIARTTQFERPGTEALDEAPTSPSAPTAEELEPWTDQDTSTASAQLPASEEEPLPPNWSKKTTKQGRDFFINHIARITTWVDPRTGQETPIPGATNASNSGTLDRQVKQIFEVCKGYFFISSGEY